jgi:fructose-bisphosphate aldolase class II
MEWTLATYREKAPGKADNEIFGKYSKYAIREFFDRIYAVGDDTRTAIDARVYAETLVFLRAFKAGGTAGAVREYIGSMG